MGLATEVPRGWECLLQGQAGLWGERGSGSSNSAQWAFVDILPTQHPFLPVKNIESPLGKVLLPDVCCPGGVHQSRCSASSSQGAGTGPKLSHADFLWDLNFEGNHLQMEKGSGSMFIPLMGPELSVVKRLRGPAV